MAENDQANNFNKHDIQFMSLIQGLAGSVMQQLGKIMNPMTGEVEKNLEGARINIDLLEMLQVKTTGNISDQEASMLTELLTNLRLNYLDELKAEQEKPAEEEAKPEAGPKEEEPATEKKDDSE